MSADKKIAELNLELPPGPKALGVYMPAIVVGKICYTAGHLPTRTDGSFYIGCVGDGASTEEGYEAARQSGLTMLSTLKNELGSLDRIKQVVKLFGMVRCADDFTSQSAVINGCSDLFKSVFGETVGVGARSSVGVNALPLGVMVEIEGIFELHD